MAKQKETALAVKKNEAALSTQAQSLYDEAQEAKGKADVARKKRLGGLMRIDRYAALKEQAGAIVKEATALSKGFDAKNPAFKKEIEAAAEEGKKALRELSKVAIIAFTKGIDLQVFRGKGPNKKRVRMALSAQPTLF